MSRFTLPRDIYHGKGCLEELKNLKGKKAILVVGGGSMKRQGFLDRAENYLKEAGMEVKLFEGVEPDPSVETVMKGAAVMQEFQPDWIVAMGGGSPIDAAKAMWTFYEYPDTKFVIIDAAPVEGENKAPEIKENVLSIFYAEEQAGYLAGYAAVEEGYRQLGFMGGIAVPAVIRFGYGFVQGADAAAKDLGLAQGDINIKYTYVGNFDASPENQAKAAAWYSEGTECIFACGGGVGNSVMKAAETAGKVVIGVDVDQSVESDTVITSAMKNLGDSVYDAVASYYDGNFAGGTTLNLSAKDDGIQLPMETSKFTKFTQEKYDELYGKLKDGSIKVENDTVAEDATGVPAEIVKVELIK